MQTPNPTCCIVRITGGGARHLERAALEGDEHVVVVEQPQRALDRVPARALQLHHQADAAAAEVDHLGERRVGDAATWAVVRHLEVVPDVELDEVGADLDRALEGRERVLRQVGRGAAVGDHEHSRSRSGTSMRSTSSSAAAIRSAPSVRVRPTTRAPAAFAAATPTSVSSKTSSSAGSTPSAPRQQVRLGVGLAARRRRGERRCGEGVADSGRVDDGLDLAAGGRRDDRDGQRAAAKRTAARIVVVDGRAVGDELVVAVDPLADQGRGRRRRASG